MKSRGQVTRSVTADSTDKQIILHRHAKRTGFAILYYGTAIGPPRLEITCGGVGDGPTAVLYQDGDRFSSEPVGNDWQGDVWIQWGAVSAVHRIFVTEYHARERFED